MKNTSPKDTVVYTGESVVFYLMQDRKTWTSFLKNAGKFTQENAAMIQMKISSPTKVSIKKV